MEQAKQNRSIYWHVPARELETRPRTDHARDATIQETAPSGDSGPSQTTATQTTTQVLEQSITTVTMPAERELSSSSSPIVNHLTEPAQEASQTSAEEIIAGAPHSTHVEEDWATPATQQDAVPQAPDSMIDPRLGTTEEPLPPGQVSEDRQAQPSMYPVEGIEGDLAMQETDTWLNEIFNDDDNTWMPAIAHDDSSLATSIANEPHSESGKIFKGCKCPEHQHIYDDWPTHDAELTIAKCMTICVYCGADCHRPPSLRMHLKAAKHARNNISVVRETMGKGSSTIPSWTAKPPGRNAHRGRNTRSQAITNRADAMVQL